MAIGTFWRVKNLDRIEADALQGTAQHLKRTLGATDLLRAIIGNSGFLLDFWFTFPTDIDTAKNRKEVIDSA